jgi:hypothetical protein
MELKPPVANVSSLVLLGVLTLDIIYAGYVHGNMDLLTTLKNAKN